MSPLSIHPMTRAELDIGIGWAAGEGWNPGLHDADSFHAADPGGFLIGRLDGEPIGMVSAVKYGAGFGFIGFYIVRPAWRGQGHGLALWHAAMARLQGRLIGLDGVVAQQANYRRSGFRLAYNNVRHEGVPQRATRRDPDVLPLTQVAFDELLRYDTAFFPEPREVFLRHWIVQRGSVALGIRRDSALAGYGVVRPCRGAFKIGPLFANDAELANRLLRALAATLPAKAVVQLDIPAANPAAVALAAAQGLAPVFQTARMYTAEAPRLALERLFGVTTFELG
jgi:GNAT superfamily N-acetyltransferase